MFTANVHTESDATDMQGPHTVITKIGDVAFIPQTRPARVPSLRNPILSPLFTQSPKNGFASRREACQWSGRGADRQNVGDSNVYPAKTQHQLSCYCECPLPSRRKRSFLKLSARCCRFDCPILDPTATSFPHPMDLLLVPRHCPLCPLDYRLLDTCFQIRRVNEKLAFPNKPLDTYIDLKSSNLRKYENSKVPMQKFHDAYFDGKVDFKGDVLEVMEYRHDWASFEFTPEVS